ncbi:MAG: hypothetical protein E6Q97_06705 [Desulfurellales bacterium]|nr:MAG: hypothetical protein E6Q97_06705 [Desulfurellales bacterium]
MHNFAVDCSTEHIKVRKWGTDEVVATLPTGEVVEVLEDMIKTLNDDAKARLFFKLGEGSSLYSRLAFKAGMRGSDMGGAN